ncbi:MAG: endonuclease domain-containing protein [Hyphomonadaceae bacterium]|nr:endonuclease domain-containing protein [Hyphomonadaceae bacterium]
MRDAERTARGFARGLRSSMTDAEVILWAHIRRNAIGWRFRRQHPIGRYVTDFACVAAKLVVEVDGPSHFTQEGRAHDMRRTQALHDAGWRVVRVSNDDIYENLDGVWRMLERALGAPPPSRPRISSADGLPPHAGEESR